MSETGFFHPDTGYWQTITTPTERYLSELPEGAYQVPLRPSGDHNWDHDNQQWVEEIVDPQITGDMINTERQRRLETGVRYNGIYIRGLPMDREILASLYNIATHSISTGDLLTLTTYRDGDNVNHTLTPPQIAAMYIAGVSYTDSLYKTSWALKELDPIPVDFEDDKYWPSSTITEVL